MKTTLFIVGILLGIILGIKIYPCLDQRGIVVSEDSKESNETKQKLADAFGGLFDFRFAESGHNFLFMSKECKIIPTDEIVKMYPNGMGKSMRIIFGKADKVYGDFVEIKCTK